MAIYHFEAKVITRGVGRSVVAAAAYASCSKIYNDYDGINHNYTKKGGLIHSEVLLPPNAPTEWQDRAELWNAVEAAEKSKNSQLVRELIVALPIELKSDEWITMLRNFITGNCVNKGMCADFSIHDTDGHNPHAHILLTMRPLDEKGRWQAKTQKEYLCKRGDEERGFTADEFKTAQADGWEKQYQYKVGKKKIYMPPSEAEAQNLERVSKNPKSTRYGRQNPICAEWNSDEQILQWRKAWEDVTNLALEQKNISELVDCRSFKERGIDEQPTIHEGAAARIMEKRGFVSDRCEENRQIRKDNVVLRELKALVKELTALVENTAAKIAEKLENIRTGLISILYQRKFNGKQIEQVDFEKQLVPPLIKKHKKLTGQIKRKSAERKKLIAEKDACSPINIFKQNQLSKQLDALNDEIKELKSDRDFILSKLGCGSESEIDAVEKNHKHNIEIAERLKARNADLETEYTAEKANYIEVKSTVPPENIEAVQDERYDIRNAAINQVRENLQKAYGERYSYDIFREAETAVNDDLGEKPPSMNRYLRRKRREAKETEHCEKKREYER